ncbi:MAG: hypothetical protein K0Q95_1730 [Bacteroidota bacterium]|jgi:hypothetical protein|nr:hypothetical protein [Bacteroidota bacterium]
MTIERIEELKKAWGEKPCGHPLLKKALASNDKVCTSCGRTVYSGVRNETFVAPKSIHDLFKQI